MINRKERWVGLMVLISLAIIFLPSLFHREQRIAIETVSLIPQQPDIEPVIITGPEKPTDIPEIVTHKELFQPSLDVETVEVKASSADKPITNSKPALDEKGLPQAWVIQLASFQSQARADELQKKLLQGEHKAYTRAVDTEKGQFYRVFVGPYINKVEAEQQQKLLDKDYKVSSRLLRFKP